MMSQRKGVGRHEGMMGSRQQPSLAEIIREITATNIEHCVPGTTGQNSEKKKRGRQKEGGMFAKCAAML